MKSITTLLLCLLMFSSLYAQNNRGPSGSHSRTFVSLNGLKFVSKNSQYIDDGKNPQYCEHLVVSFNIEGIELSRKNILDFDLDLQQNDVIDSNSYYSYEYKNNDTLNCIEKVYYFVSLNMPIILNGKELKADEKEIALKKIHPDQLIEVKFNRCFFTKTNFEIKTR